MVQNAQNNKDDVENKNLYVPQLTHHLRGLHAHYEEDIVCDALYNIDKLTPIECTLSGRNTSRANGVELQERLKYHRRININKKQYYRTFSDTGGDK